MCRLSFPKQYHLISFTRFILSEFISRELNSYVVLAFCCFVSSVRYKEAEHNEAKTTTQLETGRQLV